MTGGTRTTSGPALAIRVPGDKSVSQRALILAAIADGESCIQGLLRSADPLATGRALQALGVEIDALEGAATAPVRVRGTGLRSWRTPATPLDLANSGTGARLLAGALAAQPLSAILTGDASLVRRPMERIVAPLRRMGASVAYLDQHGRLPFRIRGGDLRAISHASPVASAQVKSAVLLAGVGAGTGAEVVEPRRSRDHTERMLSAMGVEVEEAGRDDGAWVVRVAPPPARLAPLETTVPGDFSSAAFFLAWAALTGARGLVVRAVGLSRTRTGLLDVLSRMGATVRVSAETSLGGEPAGDVRVEGQGGLRAVEVGGAEVPEMIDELPILAALAARAEGVTRITGAAELRVKESDRISALVDNLRRVGVEAEELPDGLEIEGTRRKLAGRVRCFGDHRIAMAFGVLGATQGCDIEVDDPAVADVSFPGFWRLLDQVGRTDGRPSPPECVVVAIDGTAGAGKSTTAKAVADQLGFRHLDSGAIYRAVALGLLDSGREMSALEKIAKAELDALQVHVEWRGRSMEVWAAGARIPNRKLRTERVSSLASRVSSVPTVRDHLLALQRSAAQGPGLIAEGRDMGTVVFPDAGVKVFLVADARERARRRLLQNGQAAPSSDRIEAEAARLRERDARDSSREAAPLAAASDAVRVDTTNLLPEDQVDEIVKLVERRRNRS